MKKYFLILTTIVILFLTTACGNKASSVKCTLSTKDAVNEYSLKSTYTINYTGNLVDYVETLEEVTSEKSEILDEFESKLLDTYKKMDENYGGYTYDVTKNDGKVTSKVKIDYRKMDMEELVKDQPSLKNYVKDNKLKLKGLQSMYESMGATCK